MSDLLVGLSSPCPCGMSRAPSDIKSVVQVQQAANPTAPMSVCVCVCISSEATCGAGHVCVPLLPEGGW